MDDSAQKLLFGIALVFGFCLMFFPPAVTLGQKQKLGTKEFATNITLPSTIGLGFLLVGYLGFYAFLNYDEQVLQYLIIIATCVSFIISLLSISLSLNRIRFASF